MLQGSFEVNHSASVIFHSLPKSMSGVWVSNETKHLTRSAPSGHNC
jgi:hypothetical protein